MFKKFPQIRMSGYRFYRYFFPGGTGGGGGRGTKNFPPAAGFAWGKLWWTLLQIWGLGTIESDSQLKNI